MLQYGALKHDLRPPTYNSNSSDSNNSRDNDINNQSNYSNNNAA